MRPDINRLISEIREARRTPEAWPEVLASLTRALGVAGAAIIVSSKNAGKVEWACLSGLSAELEADYIDHYSQLDPFTPLLGVKLGWTKLSETFQDHVLRKSVWYNDFVLACGVRDILGARLVETSSHFVTFGLHQQLGRRFAEDSATIVKMLTKPLVLAARRQVANSFGSGTTPEWPVVTSRQLRGAESKRLIEEMKYFFHLSNGQLYIDSRSQFLPSLEAALAHASAIADELAEEEGWGDFAIHVADDDGRILASVPIPKA